MQKKSNRSVRNISAKTFLGIVAVSAALSGFAATPALADRWDHQHHRHERWEHRHHHRPHVYYAPGYYGPPPVVYEAPPPVYYAPPPPPPVYYGAPSLNVVIPIR
jgi:hypothetical protein